MKSRMLLKPPVLWRLASSLLRFFDGETAARERFRRSITTGSDLTSGFVLLAAASPRLRSDFSVALANGAVFFVSFVRVGAAAPSSEKTGVAWSANDFSWTLVDCRFRRKSGNFWNPASRAALRSAVARAVTPALAINPETWRRSRASGARTVWESLARFASTWFWLARMWRT